MLNVKYNESAHSIMHDLLVPGFITKVQGSQPKIDYNYSINTNVFNPSTSFYE